MILSERFADAELIDKGWSGDKKYRVTDADGRRMLLRVSDISELDRKKAEYDMMERVYNTGVLTSRPVEFGVCDDGKSCYSLSGWLDGADVETALPLMTETEQYILGLKAGETLRKIHALPAPTREDWEIYINSKTDALIQEYQTCGVLFDGDEQVLAYIEENRHAMPYRPQCTRHSDYHAGNMMVENSELYIIDFGMCDFGDPWEDLSSVVLGARYSPHFATGQIRGYFGGEPPREFFRQFTFYIASNMLSSICWAAPVGQVEIDYYLEANRRIMEWHDNMSNPVPSWYLREWMAEK